MKVETVNILGVKVARMDMAQVLEWIRMMMEQGKPRHIVTANAEIIYAAYQDPELRRLLEKADLVTADGIGVVWAARHLKQPVAERVTGIDLVNHLLTLAESKGWKVYFLGAQPEVVEKAVLNTLSQHPRLRIAGYQHGYYYQEEIDQVLSNINKVETDILLVAMGAPKQEEFIQRYCKELSATISIGVGGSFDVMAGVAQRAPLWMQRVGLEWLYRLYKNPWRFNRMLALPKFIFAVLRQGVGSK